MQKSRMEKIQGKDFIMKNEVGVIDMHYKISINVIMLNVITCKDIKLTASENFVTTLCKKFIHLFNILITLILTYFAHFHNYVMLYKTT